MKIFPLVLFIVLLVGFVACKKEKTITPPPAPEIKVLLKDIVQTNLPSPRYHFEYNGEKKITKAAFSSSMAVYNLSYNNELIMERNNGITIDKDDLFAGLRNGCNFQKWQGTNICFIQCIIFLLG